MQITNSGAPKAMIGRHEQPLPHNREHVRKTHCATTIVDGLAIGGAREGA